MCMSVCPECPGTVVFIYCFVPADCCSCVLLCLDNLRLIWVLLVLGHYCFIGDTTRNEWAQNYSINQSVSEVSPIYPYGKDKMTEMMFSHCTMVNFDLTHSICFSRT